MKFRKLFRQQPLFLLFIPASFLLHWATEYFGLLHWNIVMKPALLYLGLPILFYLLIRFVLQKDKANALAAYAILLFYYYFLLQQLLKSVPVVSFLGRYIILLPLLATALLILIIFCIKNRLQFLIQFHFAVNILSGLLTAGGLIYLIYLFTVNAKAAQDFGDPSKQLSTGYQVRKDAQHPDIYYLLLDSYSGFDLLKREFNFPNDRLKTFFQSKRFFIPEQSSSNYNQTFFSLPSEFNLNYLRLEKIKDESTVQSTELFRGVYSMYKNEWCRILEKEGYRIFNHSIFDLEHYPLAEPSPWTINIEEESVWGFTFFRKLRKDIGWHFLPTPSQEEWHASAKPLIEDAVQRIGNSISAMNNSIQLNSTVPKFVYGHLLLPHEPPVYDSLGQRVPLAVTLAPGSMSKESYISQIKYVNRFIIEPMVEKISEEAQRPYVIIIKSDHGSRSFEGIEKEYQFESLNAIYFSDEDYTDVPDNLSNVNLFRIIANHYFKQNYPLLPNQQYFFSR